MSRLLIIANPKAGRLEGESTAATLGEALCRDGHDIRTRLTAGPGHASEIAAEEGENVDAVLSVGGDGTLREVIVGLENHENLPVGIIPLGCANVLARELGIPRGRPVQAARRLLSGSTIAVDLGLAGKQPFLANVGAGFDARVVEALHRNRGRRNRGVNMSAYLPIGTMALVRFRTPRLFVGTQDANRIGPFHSITICNTSNYGGIMKLTPKARIDDGLLDCHVRRGRGRRTVVRHVACALFGWEDHGRAQVLRGRQFTIWSDDIREPYQVDGDPGGVLPVDVRLSPRCRNLMTPAPAEEEERR